MQKIVTNSLFFHQIHRSQQAKQLNTSPQHPEDVLSPVVLVYQPSTPRSIQPTSIKVLCTALVNLPHLKHHHLSTLSSSIAMIPIVKRWHSPPRAMPLVFTTSPPEPHLKGLIIVSLPPSSLIQMEDVIRK